MRGTHWGLAAWGVGLAFLVGCASQQWVPASKGELDAQSFRLQGRIAYRFQNRNGQVKLAWDHFAKNDSVRMEGPLGQTAAVLQRDANHAWLKTKDKEYHAANLPDLMQEVLGWTLPLDGLQWWVHGKPDPALLAQALLPPQDGFTQGDWQVEVLERDDKGARRLRLTRGELRVTLVIDDLSPLQAAMDAD